MTRYTTGFWAEDEHVEIGPLPSIEIHETQLATYTGLVNAAGAPIFRRRDTVATGFHPSGAGSS